VDIPTSKRPIYSRSSYPSVPLLSLIVSPANEQRPKSLVRSELSTPTVYLECPIESSFSRPSNLSLSRSSTRNLFDFNHFRVFSIHFPSVFDARFASARPGILFYRFRLFSIGSGMRAGYANRKRCIIVYAEYRRRPSEVPRSALDEIFLFVYFLFFDVHVSVLHAYTGEARRPPVVFHRIHGARFCMMKYDLGIRAVASCWV